MSEREKMLFQEMENTLKSSIVEFSRNFGENSDVYKDYEPKNRETGDEGPDCE